MDLPDPGEGFAEAFDRHAPAILRYAQRRLSTQDAAWDVVSDTFTAAWRHWRRRPDSEELLPWLYAIARNSVRDQRRSDERQRRLTSRLAATRFSAGTGDPADNVVGRHSIREALSRLPETDQEVLRLVAWEGQTDAQALGQVLGLSAVTARSRVHRARRRLRALLDESAVSDVSTASDASSVAASPSPVPSPVPSPSSSVRHAREA